MFVCSIFGVIVVSMIVVTVQNKFKMTNLESKAYLIVKKISLRRTLQDYAATSINNAARIYLANRKKEGLKVSLIYSLVNSLSCFRKTHR